MDNYEKKYKEALERASKLRVQNPFDTVSQMMEHVFPELAEREDERIRKALIGIISNYVDNSYTFKPKMIAWLEKQVGCELDCPQNHQDSSHPNGCIVLEDFTGGEGFYKVHLDYLNKKQVEEVEEMIRAWNTELKTPNENIKACIGMALTDVPETRFKSYGVSLKECLAWFEKQIKPKWTEEDEIGSDETIELLEYFINYAPEFRRPAIRRSIDWLKSLKQRMEEQQ